MSIEIKGLSALQTKFNNLPGIMQTQIKQALFNSAQAIQKTAVMSLRGARSGRIYHRGGVTHQASAVGEYPANDTGALANNISIKIIGDLEVNVGSRENVPHGAYLEFGTSRMSARPWLTPALQKNLELIRALNALAVSQGLGKVSAGISGIGIIDGSGGEV